MKKNCMADITLVKILFNSIISAEVAKCLMVDLNNFHLNTPMKRYEYMRLKVNNIPDEIIKEYNLHKKKMDYRYVYCAIHKGMYGLSQAGIIAHKLIQERLAKVGYYQSKIIPCLLMHIAKKKCFTLVADNFANKYTNLEDANHIINALKKDYIATVDWEANKYIGLAVEWDYAGRKVFVYMPGYLTKVLQRFNHPPPPRRKNKILPIPMSFPNTEQSRNMQRKISFPPLYKEDTKYVQAVAGALLYYGRGVDSTILPALSVITTDQVKPTEKTWRQSNSCWIIVQHRKMQSYHAMQAK
jgi:hypothetical protein